MSDGLLQSAAIDWTAVRSGTWDIPLELIQPTAENARKTFKPADVFERAESLRNHGQIKAGTVHPIGDGRFELIDGEMTWRAFGMIIGAQTMRCEVMEVDSVADVHRRMMVTHVNRTDLNPIERGMMWARERDLSGKSIEELAEQYGQAGKERTIYNLISLAKLIPDVQAAVIDERISQEHGVLIARETDRDQVKALAACFRPEATTSAAGVTDMVETLIPVKELRVWIQTNLRRQDAPAKTFFDEPAQQERAAEQQLEKQADGMIGDEPEEDEDDDDGAKEDDAASGDIAPITTMSAPAAPELGAYETEKKGRTLMFERTFKTKLALTDDVLRALIIALVPDMMMEHRRIVFVNLDVDITDAQRIDAYLRQHGDLVNRLIACVVAKELNPHMPLVALPMIDEVARLLRKETKSAAEGTGSKQPLPVAHDAPKKRGKKAQAAAGDHPQFTDKQVEKMVAAAARYIVHAMEIDDADVTSMRETGMSDNSIAALLEAHFEDETTVRDLEGFPVEFGWTKDSLRLFYAGETQPGQSFEMLGDDYFIAAIRKALDVPQAVDGARRTLNLKQLGEAIGKHTSWLATKDLPHDTRDGVKFYDAAEVKAWIAENVKERGKGVGGRPASKKSK